MRSSPSISSWGSLPSLFLCAVAASLVLTAKSAGQEAEAVAPAIPIADPLSGSLYLDPWQIEKEFVISPLALQQWIDLGLTDDSMLEPGKRDALKPVIGEFLAQKCPVLVDNEPIEFTLDRIHFIEPDNKEFVIIDPEAVVSASEVRLSVVFAAPNTRLDAPLQLLWNLFPRGVSNVVVTVADAAGTRLFRVNKIAPAVFVRGRYELGGREAPAPPAAPAPATLGIPWLSIILILAAVPVIILIVRSERKRPLAVAALVLLAGGAAVASKYALLPVAHPFDKTDAIDDQQTASILDSLLRGIYHAFDYREQSEQYDVLAKVVGGEALTDIFLEVQRTLESRERDGARVRVRDLTVEKCEAMPLENRRGFQAECSWKVDGRVGHWGHFHDRSNLYRATFQVEPLEDTWKITGLTLHARDREPSATPGS